MAFKLKVVTCENIPPTEVLAISSIALCPGDDVTCPQCAGISIVARHCNVCSGTGRVSLAQKQPGVVKLKNIGGSDAHLSK